MKLNIILIVNLILFCQAATVFSQTPNGFVSGLVHQFGMQIVGAKVTLKTVSSRANKYSINSVIETKTDSDGAFKFPNLLPGKYIIEVNSRLSGDAEMFITVTDAKPLDLIIELGKGCGKFSDKAGIITFREKTEIINLSFSKAANELISASKRKDGIILSTENIESIKINNNSGTKLTLMSKKAIQRKAEKDGDFLYLYFPVVKALGSCIAVSAIYSWAQSKKSRRTVLYIDDGAGFTIEYRKRDGKWIERYLSNWGS